MAATPYSLPLLAAYFRSPDLMPTLGIRQSTWQGLRQNQRDIMRWAFARLALGNPALYEISGGVRWFIFDDWRLDLLMFARLGALANVIAGLPAGWKPPTTGSGQNRRVDREAVEAEAISRVQASIVLPADIDYGPEDDPVVNQQQHTLDANSAPAALRGWDSVPANWVSVP